MSFEANRRWVLAGSIIVSFAIVHHFLVSNFYATRIPHYDSVGTLLRAVEIINAQRSGGYFAGLAEAWNSAPLGILQTMFVGVFAPFLQPTPSSIQIYNVVTLSIALLALTKLCNRLELSVPASFFVLAAYFTPDALYWWDLGIFDFRRDASYFALMVAAQAYAITIILRPQSGRALREGAILGVIAGLYLLSRDGAPVFGAVLLGLPCIALWGVVFLRRRDTAVLRQIVGFIAGFLPFAIILFLHLGGVLARFTDRLLQFGGGEASLSSFTHNFPITFWAIFGGFSHPWNLLTFISANMIIAITIILVCTLIYFIHRVDFKKRLRPHFAVLAAIALTGALTLIFPHLFLSFIIGWRTNMSPVTTIAPYLPATASVIWAGVLLAILIDKLGDQRLGALALFACAAFITISIPLRAQTRIINYEPQTMAAHRTASEIFSSSPARAPVIAELTTEGLRVPALQLWAAMRAEPPLERLRFEYRGIGRNDLTIAIPPEEEVAELLEVVEQAVRCDSDFVIINMTPGFYSNDDSPLLIPSRGQEMVDRLRTSLQGEPRWEVPIWYNLTLEIIDNSNRIACSAG